MKKNTNILIIDDDKQVLRSLELLLETKFEFVKAIDDPDLIMQELSRRGYDLIILDMNFTGGINSGEEGLKYLRKVHRKYPEISIIPITAFGDVDLAIKVIKEGAYDFVIKPWDNTKLVATIQAGVELSKSRSEIDHLKKKQQILIQNQMGGKVDLIGSSEAMNKIRNLIDKVAVTEANVLISGENGTGKEMIAREIHRKSKRSADIFMHVDLGAISDNLFESELFGHEKGAFTDAIEKKTGRFVLASGGSLFLDEIGNIPLTLQAKLLSVLERRKLIPVGGMKEYNLDLRLISASNRDLDAMVMENLFREDLLYRLNTIKIHLPALRDRGDDVLELSDFFLSMFKRKYDKALLRFDAKALLAIKKYPWPGNIRELKHAIEKTVILSENNVISDYSFEFNSIPRLNSAERKPVTLIDIEKRAILEALRNNRGVLSEAAKELGIARQTMYNKMAKYGI